MGRQVTDWFESDAPKAPIRHSSTRVKAITSLLVPRLPLVSSCALVVCLAIIIITISQINS